LSPPPLNLTQTSRTEKFYCCLTSTPCFAAAGWSIFGPGVLYAAN
jgi:hypothetical protein